MTEQTCLSVYELNRLLNLTLEESIPEVFFEGEISEVKLGPSGHLYITLKDERSEIRAIMWASSARSLRFRPAQGTSVRCHGRPNVWEKNGSLRIIISRMEATGAGDLQRRFLELKAKLEQEGLFAPERKRKLPFLPKAIGLVTSAQGAAVHDIMVRLRERAPQIPVYLADVRVQGEGAAAEIAAGIKYLCESGLVDVIIAGRGGGSLEDLWAFNEEVAVRAFFASSVPIISAVGHEVDVSLSDLAADVRAPTPTAAAEMVAPRREDLLGQISEYEKRLLDFERWLSPLSEEVDALSEVLSVHVEKLVGQGKLRVGAAAANLKAIEPHRLIHIQRARLEMCSERLESLSGRNLAEAEAKLKQLADVLGAVNPARVLDRGYAIVRAHGQILKSSEDVRVGEPVSISLKQGGLKAKIVDTVPEESSSKVSSI